MKVKEFENRKTSQKSQKEVATTIERTTEEVELLSVDELSELKEKLITKLNSIAQDIGLKIKFTENDVTAIECN